MITAIITIGIASFALVCVAAMVAILERWQTVGLYAIALFSIIAWELPDTPSLVSAAGVQIKVEDAVCVALAVSTIVSAATLRNNVGRWWAILVFFTACVATSLLTGMAQYGPQAFNEARSTIWLLVALAWVLSRDWSESMAEIRRLFLRVGAVLSALAALHVVLYGWGGADTFVTAITGVLQTGRPLVSGQALVLLCCGLALVLTGGKTRTFELIVGYVFVIVSILCMHRSVWIAAFVGLIIIAVSLRGRALGTTAILGFYAFVALVCVVASNSLPELGATVTHALSSDGTLNAREGSWTELISQSVEDGWWTVIFGTSFGAGWARMVNGVFVDFNPHNWYVVLYLRLGLVGLAVAVTILLLTVRRLASRSRAFLAVALSICAYAWFYHLPWYVAPWLGLALYIAASARSRDATVGHLSPGKASTAPAMRPNRSGLTRA